jgi:PAS domain S-box-containing protein
LGTIETTTELSFGGQRSLPLLLALMAAGLLGNHYRYPIFLDVDFLFGSVFAMLALQLFGTARGIVAAAVIASYTYFIWNHPYAIVYLTAESAVVALLYRRGLGLVLADTLYWLAAGMPLIYLFTNVIMQVPFNDTKLITIKMVLNGIANTMVARLIFTAWALQSRKALFSYRETVYNLSVFFVAVPGLVILAITSRADYATSERAIRTELVQDKEQSVRSLEAWIRNRTKTLATLAEMASEKSTQQMQISLEQAVRFDQNFLRIGLQDKDAISIAFFPPADDQGKSALGRSFADRPFIPALRQSTGPMLSEVFTARIGRPVPIEAMFAPVRFAGKYRGYIAGVLSLEQVREHLSGLRYNETLYTLIDGSGAVIMTSRTDQAATNPFTRGSGRLNRLNDEVSQWVPDSPANLPITERWKRSYYVTEVSIGTPVQWKLILEKPVAPFQQALNENYSGKLTVLLFLLLATMALAELISRKIVSSLDHLAALTSELPAKLSLGGTDFAWPESSFREAVHLIKNFRAMADSLLEKFRETSEVNEALEHRVQERTLELQRMNLDFVYFLEGTTDFVFFMDHDGLIRFCSQQLAVSTGHRHWKELIGKHARELFPPETARVFQGEDLAIFREGGALLDKVAPIVDFQGTRSWISTSKWPVFDADRKVVGIFGISRDVTEQKRMLTALEESETKYRLIFDHAGDPIYIHDGSGRILAVNPKACELLGYSIQELMSLTIDQVDAPEEKRHILERVALLMRQGHLMFQTVHQRKDGSLLPVEVSSRKICWDGTPAIMSIARDLTLRMQAEERLLEAKNFTEKVINSAQEGVVVYGPDLRYRIWNPFMQQITGLAADEVLSRHPAEVFPAAPAGETVERLKKVLSGELLPAQDVQYHVAKTARSGWVSELFAPLLNRKGAIIGVIATVREISWRKRMEDELRGALAGAETANANMARLLHTVAHEFRTPLGLVTGCTSILERYWDRLTPEQRRQQHATIQSATRQLAQLIDSIMTFHTPQVPAPGSPCGPLQIGALCRRIATEVEKVWSSGHHLRIAVAHDCGTAWLDKVQFRRVLENLLTNAFRYTLPGGTVSLRVSRTRDVLLVEIADTGIGIPEEDLELIFIPFHRGRNVQGRRGLGLGLSIVHESLALLGGTIAVRSEFGVGTAMTVRIPGVDRREFGQEGVTAPPAPPEVWPGRNHDVHYPAH